MRPSSASSTRSSFSEAAEPPGVVISYSLWKGLGSDPAVIGRSRNLSGRMLRVLGVAPAGWANRHIHGFWDSPG